MVTAGHCIHSPYQIPIEFETLTVYLGKSDLNSLTEKWYILSAVSSISVHPDWKPDGESRDSDIAALVLSRNIVSSKFVKPICIWTSTKSFSDLIGSTGTIAGWGFTNAEARTVSFENPQWTEVKIVDQETCLRSQQIFVTFTSSKTFCARDEAGLTGPCTADSGNFDDHFEPTVCNFLAFI